MTFDLDKARAICNESLAEIERLRALRTDILQALGRPKTASDQGILLYVRGEVDYNRTQAARIQELEEALAEYQRLGKIMKDRLPCLTLHGECDRCSSRAKEVCDAMHQIAEGKIGPDVALKKQWDEVLDAKSRSWQITDERKAAMQHILMCHHCRYDDSSCKASEVLRAMLEAEQE